MISCSVFEPYTCISGAWLFETSVSRKWKVKWIWKHDPEYDRKCFAWYVKKKFDNSKIKRNQNRINIFLIFFYVSYPMKVKFMWVVISLYGRFTGLTIILYIVSINKVITHCVYFLFNRLVSNDFKNQWSIYHCLWVLYLMLLRIVHNNEFILRGQQKILRSGTILLLLLFLLDWKHSINNLCWHEQKMCCSLLYNNNIDYFT